mmetsp:Transcript_42235/g.133058  ORF Transcript_42235/g.133058 Transcript_42235/m.133058 type:complete len:174 (-) Transcript_42235:249-770(-)
MSGMEGMEEDTWDKDEHEKFGGSDSMSDFVHVEASELTEAEREVEVEEVGSSDDATAAKQSVRSDDEEGSKLGDSFALVPLMKGAHENWQFRFIRNSALLIIALKIVWRVINTYRERQRLKEQVRSSKFAIRMLQAELLSVLADRQQLEKLLLDVADQNHMLRTFVSDKWFFF